MNCLLKSFKNLASNALAPINLIHNDIPSYISKRFGNSLMRMHKINMKEIPQSARKKKSALDGLPYAKGVILKTLVKKPRKPNSANRKCVLVKLSNGKEMTAYIPGEGHNLQEHQVVLCKVGKLKDVPGVKIKCVRGKYDLPHVVKGSKV